MTTRLVVVGDALLDRDLCGPAERLCPDAPVPVIAHPTATARPGGAGLAALLAAHDGVAVTLVAPLAADAAGRELAGLLERAGVAVVPLSHDGTTAEKVRVRAGEQSVARLDYGTQGRIGALTNAASAALGAADGVLVSDYGRGVTRVPSVRDALAAAAQRQPVVWDPHPRGAAPVRGVRLATPNRAETAALTGLPVDTLADLAAAGLHLLERWSAAEIAITLGAHGALLVSADGTPLAIPAPPAQAGDPCGAGDRFAASAAAALAGGALPSEAVVAAVAAASAFVAAGGAGAVDVAAVRPRAGGALPAAARPDAGAVLRRVRDEGGTVVATGGCFDLLHAGHVRMLESARALGDCLVVCINSDASVRRLKGPDRPLVPEADRGAVLASLACVDAVAVFDEDTPERILAELRPDVWAKGADYAVADLPEAPLLATWGGQAVVLPYLDGRSTTRILEEAARRAHH
jgi:D-beta-D-heptose 7-phosphate kinase / D-beta-D-heptose 1-phosphate adenosyltransferase